MVKHRLQAITVARFYLDHQLWAIKLMQVVESKTSTLIWNTVSTIVVRSDYDLIKSKAEQMAETKNLPYRFGLVNGLDVTPNQWKTLMEYHNIVNYPELPTSAFIPINRDENIL
ncbi:hypothetical protein ES705_43541 [subsurface metagenome]